MITLYVNNFLTNRETACFRRSTLVSTKLPELREVSTLRSINMFCMSQTGPFAWLKKSC
jgi:hypothetical protein